MADSVENLGSKSTRMGTYENRWLVMCAYRISKYNPLFRTENGYYLNDEWTSYSDIGKIFYNKVFTKDDYLSFENKYCDTVLSILKYLNIKKSL